MQAHQKTLPDKPRVYQAVSRQRLDKLRLGRLAKATTVIGIASIVAYVGYDTFRFMRDSFFKEVDSSLKYYFRFHLREAVQAAEAIKNENKINVSYYSDQIVWAYLYRAIFLGIHPVELRKDMVMLEGPHRVEAIGDTYFKLDYLQKNYFGDFVYVVYPGERLPCKFLDQETEIEGWLIGICRVR